MKEELLKLDSLRKEKDNLEYFLRGNGNFGITIDMKLFKHFGCGQHELLIRNKETQEIIFNTLKNRLVEIDSEINELLGLEA